MTKKRDDNKETVSESLAASFQKLLNTHGYGFQFAIQEHIANADSEKNPWDLVVPEFPVSLKGKSTRIDFILKHKKEMYQLICESKRTDPKYSNWCFIRGQYPDRPSGHRDATIYAEAIIFSPQLEGYDKYSSCIIDFYNTEDPYHIGLVLKTKSTPEAMNNQGKDAIENAATQVCRGLNGYIDFYANSRIPVKTGGRFFFPVIFTTASLWTTQVKLNEADMQTGNLEGINKDNFQKVKWLWYLYPQSPDLRHSLPATDDLDLDQGDDAIKEIFYRDYLRPIAIVNHEGIEEFLNSSTWDEISSNRKS